MRGTGNKRAVFRALQFSSYVKALLDVEMIAMKDRRYFVCSSDAVGLLSVAAVGQ